MHSPLRDAFRRNYRDIYGFAYRMVGNHEEAEDIAQEAFLRLARNASADLKGESARRWLFVVARNHAISRLRRNARHHEVTLDGVAAVESPAANPGEAEASLERCAQVRAAVLELPPHMREVVVLREYEGMAYAEIAAVVGCSEGTVKSRLARAREVLRKRLSPLLENGL